MKKKWTSEVFIEAFDDVEESTEYLAYDLNDLVGSVGGYLGLFLGWSLLGLSQGVFTVCSNVLRSRIPPLQKMT